ncbi:NlpE-like protein with OB domain [Variovorax sp. OV329]|nr:NlpE-like protein with OB domain [Variovorax sp. OV329]
MEEDYAAMEKAYLNSKLQPKAPLLVSLKGRLEMRKPMEGPAREHLVVEKLEGSKVGSACKPPQQKSEHLR